MEVEEKIKQKSKNIQGIKILKKVMDHHQVLDLFRAQAIDLLAHRDHFQALTVFWLVVQWLVRSLVLNHHQIGIQFWE